MHYVIKMYEEMEV